MTYANKATQRKYIREYMREYRKRKKDLNIQTPEA